MVRPDTTVTVVPARFAIEAGSRFPRLGIDYNSVIHKYTNEYISPRSYRVYIDAFPGGSITTLEDPEAEQRRPGEPRHGPPTHQVVTSHLNVGADTKFEFSITRRASKPPFSATLTKGLRSISGGPGFFSQADPAWECIFDVPWPGDFNVVVTTHGHSGPGNSRNLKLKIQDRLVVSIGDSAASGQGNPDTPGEASAGYHPDVGWFDIIVSVLVPGAASYVLTREVLNYAWDQLNQKSLTLARVLDYKLKMDPKPVARTPTRTDLCEAGQLSLRDCLRTPLQVKWSRSFPR